MTKRIEQTRRFVMISMAIIMLVSSMLACVLPGQGENGSETAQPIPIDPDDPVIVEDVGPVNYGGGDQPGLSIRLSDGQEIPTEVERLIPSRGVPLTEEEIEAILARLTPWVEDQALAVDFRLPEQILRPPLTGDTIPETFPTATDLTGPQPVFGEELEVLRHAPDGEVAIAPFISVTFN
ncbi:MAG: hypothetical protein HQ574_01040, partial [Chloroflexi bacterium]|nr:hypothetical protein [Chloroflexota bacterium]